MARVLLQPAVTLLVGIVLAPLAAPQDRLAKLLPTALARMLSEEGRAGMAVEALVARGPDVAEAVVDALRGDERTQRAALLVLRRLGPSAADVVPQLLRLLGSCDPKRAPAVYSALAEVLSLTEPPSPTLNERLYALTQEVLARTDEATGLEIRRGHMRVFIRIHVSKVRVDEEVIGLIKLNRSVGREFATEKVAGGHELLAMQLPLLRELLASEPPAAAGGRQNLHGSFVVPDRFLMKVARAVERAQGHRLDHVHRHRYWLLHGNTAERVDAAMSLGTDVRRADAAVPALIDALDDPSLRVVGEAVTALGMLGSAASQAEARVEVLAQHSDPQVAERARSSLRQIRGR